MSDNTAVATIDQDDYTDAELVEVTNEDAIDQALAALKTGHNPGIVHSFIGDDEDTMDAVLAALSDTTPIDEVIGKPLSIVNYIAQKVRLRTTNPDTGEVRVDISTRITFVDADDNAYNVTSGVVMRDLMTWIAMRGEPHQWTKPLVVRFEKGGQAPRRFITGKIVPAKKAGK